VVERDENGNGHSAVDAAVDAAGEAEAGGTLAEGRD
jgi:hypothetical protein